MIRRLSAFVILIALTGAQGAAAHTTTAALCRNSNVNLRNTCTLPAKASSCGTSCKMRCETGPEESSAPAERPALSPSVKTITIVLTAGPLIHVTPRLFSKDVTADLTLLVSPERDVFLLNATFLI